MVFGLDERTLERIRRINKGDLRTAVENLADVLDNLIPAAEAALDENEAKDRRIAELEAALEDSQQQIFDLREQLDQARSDLDEVAG